MADPFHIFPEEVSQSQAELKIWADILVKLDDSEDIFNALEAYPQLRILSKGKEYSWLISDILPLIIPKYLATNHIFVCRLVSKRWNNAISNILETHPDRLPYKFCKLKKITETHFNYHKLPLISTNLAKFVYKNFRMEDIPKRTSPFPGGHVTFNVENTKDSEDPYHCFREHGGHYHLTHIECRQALPLLKIYGHHIIHLDVKIRSLSQLASEFINDKFEYPWFQCLSCLTNLKSLKIIGLEIDSEDIPGEKRNKILEFISKSEYPFQLETLNVLEFHSVTEYADVIHGFITSLAKHGQIKKLVIHAESWKSEYSELFPNLCDLQVRMPKLWEIPEKLIFQTILSDLRCAPIHKLKSIIGAIDIGTIVELCAESKIEFLEITGIILEIRHKKSLPHRFKKFVSSLYLSRVGRQNGGEKPNKKKVIVPSIKCLSLKLDHCYNVWFEYLSSLPPLENSTVDITAHPLLYQREGDYEDFRNYFFEYVKNFYLSKQPKFQILKVVWEQFPNLKLITLYTIDSTYQYTRECEEMGFYVRKIDFCVKNK